MNGDGDRYMLKGSSTSIVGYSSSVLSASFLFSLPTGNTVLGRPHVLPPGEVAEDIQVGIPIAGRIQSWAEK